MSKHKGNRPSPKNAAALALANEQYAKVVQQHKPKPTDIRAIIAKEIKRRKRSRTWFCKELDRIGACSERHAWRYLSGEQDATGEIIGAMFDLLDLEVKPRPLLQR